MKKFITACTVIGTLFTNALIMNTAGADETGKAKQIEDKFKAADKNNDGKLTLEEAQAGMPRVAKGFAKIDTANNGYVTVDQIKAISGN